jgi:hypothetical protein
MNNKIRIAINIILSLLIVFIIAWILNWGYVKVKHNLWKDAKHKDLLEQKK